MSEPDPIYKVGKMAFLGRHRPKEKHFCLCGCGESFCSRNPERKYLNETHKKRQHKRRQRGSEEAQIPKTWDAVPVSVKEAMSTILVFMRNNNIFGYQMNDDGKNHFVPKRSPEEYQEIQDGGLSNAQIQKKLDEGYVYLIESENGVYKIGKAKDVDKRVNTFGVKLPIKTTLLHSFWSSQYSAAEKKLHEMFKDKRTHGEWFYLSREDVNSICAIKDGQL